MESWIQGSIGISVFLGWTHEFVYDIFNLTDLYFTTNFIDIERRIRNEEVYTNVGFGYIVNEWMCVFVKQCIAE